MDTEHHGNLKRFLLWGIAILLQFGYIYSLLSRLWSSSVYVSTGMTIVGVLFAITVANRRMNPAYKLSWIFLFLALPIIGILFYLIEGRSKQTKKLRREMMNAKTILNDHYLQDESVKEEAKKLGSMEKRLVTYLTENQHYSVYGNTEITYFAESRDAIDDMREHLRRAKKFIFMEYFIIANDSTWNEILDILRQKCEEGVVVRFLYDDAGTLTKLPDHYARTLEEAGIEVQIFNPLIPIPAFSQNTRDHRKICVIDGLVGYTGGYNLADEYAGRSEPYGKWKDNGLRLEGEAVRSLTLIFLEMWHALRTKTDDIEAYFPLGVHPQSGEGYCIPYADSPLDKENVGKNVYLQMIQNATKYVYLSTPYLILDNETVEALSVAAKSGVDVRIATPHIPDKKMVFKVTRSYYSELIDNGVRIYEWESGFLHGKCLVADDKVAVCGTINFDYRSLYLHFENACVMIHHPSVFSVRDDLLEIYQNGIEITKEYCDSFTIFTKYGQAVLRLFSPLL